MPYLMKCGHIAQGTAVNGSPVCVICAGIDVGAYQIARECIGTDGLKGRIAKCCYRCGSERESSWGLPYFEYRSDRQFDSFYCGSCHGWD